MPVEANTGTDTALQAASCWIIIVSALPCRTCSCLCSTVHSSAQATVAAVCTAVTAAQDSMSRF
jgi:hypothetical protein